MRSSAVSGECHVVGELADADQAERTRFGQRRHVARAARVHHQAPRAVLGQHDMTARRGDKDRRRPSVSTEALTSMKFTRSFCPLLPISMMQASGPPIEPNWRTSSALERSRRQRNAARCKLHEAEDLLGRHLSVRPAPA